MRSVNISKYILDTTTPFFHIATLSESLDDAPNGIWIENDFVKSNPEIRTVEVDGVVYRFFAIDPLNGIGSQAPIHTIREITSLAVPGTTLYGNDCPIELYAECSGHDSDLTNLIEDAIQNGTDPPELTEFICNLLRTGFKLSCEFMNILRKSYQQYWLRSPSDNFQWAKVFYYCKTRKAWFAGDTPEGFASQLLNQTLHGNKSTVTAPIHILLRIITEDDLSELRSTPLVSNPTFAEEMIETALVLKQANV